VLKWKRLLDGEILRNMEGLGMKTIRSLILGIFLILSWCASYADAYDVYLKNHRVEGNVIVRQGTFYFPVIPLAEAMKLNLGTSKEMIWVGAHPDEGTKARVVLNGTPFSDSIVGKNGTVYVALKGYANVFGYKVLINQATQVIDIVAEERTTTHTEFQNKLTRTFNKLFPDPVIEELNDKPDLRDYLLKIKDWLIRSAIMEDTATEELNHAWNIGANIRSIQDMYDAIAQLSKGFKMEVDGKRALQKSFNEIIPPKEFQGSHTLLAKIISRFSDYEALAQREFILSKQLHPKTEVRSDEYITRIDKNIVNQIVQLDSSLEALDEKQLDDFVHYLEAFRAELDTVIPASKPMGILLK